MRRFVFLQWRYVRALQWVGVLPITSHMFARGVSWVRLLRRVNARWCLYTRHLPTPQRAEALFQGLFLKKRKQPPKTRGNLLVLFE